MRLSMVCWSAESVSQLYHHATYSTASLTSLSSSTNLQFCNHMKKCNSANPCIISKSFRHNNQITVELCIFSHPYFFFHERHSCSTETVYCKFWSSHRIKLHNDSDDTVHRFIPVLYLSLQNSVHLTLLLQGVVSIYHMKLLFPARGHQSVVLYENKAQFWCFCESRC